jgi:transcriptional regulator with XRE-family HTH domain
MEHWNCDFARARMEELLLRRSLVARKIGIEPASLSHYLQGKARPGPRVLDALAKILRVNVADLERVKQSAG